MRKLALLLFVVFCCTACSIFITPPEVDVKDISIVGLDSKGADIDLLLSVKNPNSYSLKLMGYSYDLKVMSLPLAKGGARETFDFKGGAATEIRLPVRVPYRSLYEILKRGPDPDRLPYRLEVGLEVESPLGYHAVPIEQSGVFKVPEKYRPSFYMQKFSDLIQQTLN